MTVDHNEYVLTVFYERSGVPNKIYRECHEHIDQDELNKLLDIYHDIKKRGDFASLKISIGIY